MIQAVEPEILPPSYRVSPKDTDADAIRRSATASNKPGVRDVAFAQEAVKNFEVHRHHQHRSWLLGARPAGGGDPADPQHHPDGHLRPTPRDRGHEAGRRHQLVHPHPVHDRGLIQSLVGAVAAVGVIYGIGNYLGDRAAQGDAVLLLNGFTVHGSQMFNISILVVALGVIVAAVGAGVAVTRFLDV